MATRSTLIAIVPDSSDDIITGLFTAITYMDLLGGWLINRVLAVSFAMGIEIGGLWLGLPMFTAAVIWSSVLLIVISVSIFLVGGEPEVVDRPTSRNEFNQLSQDLNESSENGDISNE